MDEQPFIRVDWIADNLDAIGLRLVEHLQMTVIAVVVGLVISFALALIIRAVPRLYGPVIGITGTMYSIPSLALFALLVPITGLSLVTAEIALVSYTLLILVRRLGLPLRREQLLCFEHDDDTAGRHHRHRVRGVEERVDPGFSAIHPVVVERAEVLLHDVRELGGDRALLQLVVAHEQVQGTGLPGGNLVPER